MRKRAQDDLADWRRQNENRAAPFPHVYPDLPPKFRRLCRTSRVLYLGEWVGIWLFCVFGVLCLPYVFDKSREVPLWIALPETLFIFTFMIFALLRLIQGQRWRCPSCGKPFPYCRPTRYRDELARRDCLRELEGLHIPCRKPRFCSLVLPGECPRCRKKFWAESGQGEPWEWER